MGLFYKHAREKKTLHHKRIKYFISYLIKYGVSFFLPWWELFAFKITEPNNPPEPQRGEVFPYVK